MALFTTPPQSSRSNKNSKQAIRRLRGSRHNLLAIQFMTFLPGTVWPKSINSLFILNLTYSKHFYNYKYSENKVISFLKYFLLFFVIEL